MPSIARRNLFEDIPRFLFAQAGIMFSVSLVTIQWGILNGFTRSTARLVDQSRADLWVGAKDMVHLELSSPLPAERVNQAQRIPGVARAEALSIRSSLWRNTAGDLTPVRIFGFAPDSRLFAGWQVLRGNLGDLKQPYTVFLDQANLRYTGLQQPGDRGEIGALPAQLVGLTVDTQSIASSVFIFTSLENANTYSTAGLNTTVDCKFQGDQGLVCVNQFTNAPNRTPNPLPTPRALNATDPISYVLIQAQAGQDLAQLQRQIQAALPDTRVLTQAEMANQTRNFWQQRTGVGFILGLGATVGFIVGMVIVGQILYTSVSDHLQEFGTLKAMGASNWVIYRVIMEQALWMAVLGYIPSIVLCLGLGSWTLAAKGITILITPLTASGVFVLTVVMCVGSALFAIQKVTKVDPAIVFKA